MGLTSAIKAVGLGDVVDAAKRSLVGSRCLRAVGLRAYSSAAQEATVTLSGTFDVGDVWTVIINGTPYVYTALVTDTNLAGVATALAALIDADAAVAASAAGAVVTVTASDATAAFTIMASATNDAAGTNDQGCAVAITTAQVATVTVGGTFEATDVFTVTLDGVAFAHTVAGGDTNNDGIATALAALIDADAAYTAAAVGAVVTITKAANGLFTIATTAVDHGGTDDQTAVAAITSTQQATATLSGTFNVGDVYTVTLGGVAYSYTVLAGAINLNGVATALAAVIDAAADYTASAAGAVVTIAKASAGSFTITASATNDAAGTNDQAVAVVNTINSVKELETQNTAQFLIGGLAYSKAATTAIVVTGSTLAGSSFRWYTVQIGSTGAITTQASADNVGLLSDPADGHTVLGAFKVETDTTHTFTPATTALNATGITTTCYDLSCIPVGGVPT